MSENEKKYYLNIQAGANQSQNLAALMRNYGTALEATATAEKEENSAAKENARYMDSLAGKLANLKSAWENFSRTMVNSDMIKDGIDALTKALDFLATDTGQSMIKLARDVGVAFLAFKGLARVFSGGKALAGLLGFGKSTKLVTKALKGSGKHIDDSAKAFGRLGKAAGSVAPEIAGMTAGLGSLHTLLAVGGVGFGLLGAAGITAGILALNKAIDGTEDPAKKYKQLKDEIGKLKDKIAGYNDEIQKLEEKGGKGDKKLSGAEKQRLEWLKEQTAELKEQVELKEKLAKKEKQKKIEHPQGKDPKVQTKVKGTAAAVGKGSSSMLKQMEDSTAKQKGYTDELITSVKHWQEGVASVGREAYRTGKVNQDSAKNFKDELEKVKKTQKDVIDAYGGFDKLPPKLKKSYKAAQDIEKGYKGIQKTLGKLGGEDWATLTDKQVKEATSSFKQLGEAIGVSVDESGDLKSVDYSSFIGGLQSAGFTADQARDALIALGNEHPEATFELDGIEVAGAQVEQCINFLDKLNGSDPTATVTVDGVEYAVQDIGSLENYMRLINGETCTTDVELQGADEVLAEFIKINQYDIPAKIQEISGDNSGAKEAMNETNSQETQTKTQTVKGDNSGAKKAMKEANALKPRDKTLTVRGRKDGSFTSAKSALENTKSKSVTLSVWASVSGTAKKLMSKLGFAQGTHNAPEGLAEVNEQGYEFIRDAKTGKLRIAGGGKRTVTHLNEGDIVYTHAESKRMVADNDDIIVPQHKSGKGKKQNKYNEAREKVKDKYEKRKEETEHKSKVRHWTDAQLQKQKEKDLERYKKNVAKENKKWSGVKKKGVEREEKYEVREGRADVDHDKWARKIEKAIEKLSQSGVRDKKSKEYKNAQKVINQAKNKKYISGDERRDYLEEINGIIQSNVTEGADRKIEEAIDAYENYGSTYKDAVAIINNEYKKHRITKAEKAEYIRKLKEVAADKKSDKSKSEIEKAIETVEKSGDTRETEAKIEEAFKAHKITSEERKSYLEALKEAQRDFEERAYSKIMSGVSEAQTSAQAREALVTATAKVEEMYKQGLITAGEREDYLDDIASQRKELSRHQAERELSSMMEGLQEGGELAYTENKIADMYKQGLINEEEREDYLKQARETAQEYKHEQATKAIETFMSGVRGTDADFTKIKQQIEAEAKAGNISSEEREQYLKEAYKQNLDYNMKLFASNKKTYADMRKTLEQYYKEGKLTAAEYYEYLESLMQEQLAQQQKALEKMQTNNSNAYSLAQAYVNKQIKALQEDNEELDKQNELLELQANLEKAKNQKVRVYREGVGFVYERNTEAIKEATDALRDFHKAEKSPELQKWEEISDLFGELEEQANMRDLEVRLGTTAQALVGGLGTDVTKWATWIKNNLATGLGYTSILEAMGELTTAEDIDKFLSGTNDTLSQSYINSMINKNRFASGTLNSPAGLARVAEQGYEIALLGKGDAVMPHNVSKNLMDWGAYSPHDFAKAVDGEGKQVSYNFDKLVLPNVANADDFIRELNRLPNKALQFGTSRI